MNRSFQLLASLLTVIFLISGCSSSELVNTWKDAEFIAEHKYDKLLVIAIGEHVDTQKLFENLFEKNFKQQNVEAVKSYPHFGSSKKLNKEEIIKLVNDLEVDGVLITHLKNTETEGAYSINVPTQVSGSNYGSMYTYYNSTYEYVHTQGAYQEKVKVYLETRLFDVKEERMVWSTLSATVDPKDVRKAIEEIQELIIEQMKKDAVI